MNFHVRIALSYLAFGGILVAETLSGDLKEAQSTSLTNSTDLSPKTGSSQKETQPAEQVKDKAPDGAIKKNHKHHSKTHHKKSDTLQAKETPPKTTSISQEKAPSTRREGWFVGVRAAYVPSVVFEVGYEFNSTFKLRILGSGGRYYQTYSVDSQTYNRIQFQPRKFAAMADWHPWKNGFRLSAGIAYNADRIRLNHTVTNTLLGLPASVYGNIAAKYKFRVNAPYLGFGYDSGSLGGTGISLSADAGFWFQGRVRSTFSLSGTGQNNPTVLNMTKAHLENLLNKRKLIRTMPMVSLGVRYLF